jgi:hypothetical protein
VSPKKTDKTKLDRLAELIRELPPEQLDHVLRKREVVRLRLSKRDKEEIEAAAERRGMSVSAYLLHLHHEAEKK